MPSPPISGQRAKSRIIGLAEVTGVSMRQKASLLNGTSEFEAQLLGGMKLV
jgi:hypothetical protein